MKKLLLVGLLLLMLGGVAAMAAGKRIPVYGHRGARGLAPENTIRAYKVGLAVGIDYVDMDVNMTKDKVVVVTHDFALNPDFTRDSSGRWIKSNKLYIKNLTFKQLQQYDVGRLKSGTAYSQDFPEQYPVDGTHISSLKRVIEYVKRHTNGHIKYQVELKTDPAHPNWTFSPQELAKATVKVLKKEAIDGQTEIQSFDWRALQTVQKEDPKIATAYLTDTQISANMSSPIPAVAGLWSGGLLLKDYAYSIPKMIAALGGKIWGPESDELNAKLVREAHSYGLKIVPWDVDTVPEIVRMIKFRVDGIITDRPDLVRGVMAARGMSLPKSF